MLQIEQFVSQRDNDAVRVETREYETALRKLRPSPTQDDQSLVENTAIEAITAVLSGGKKKQHLVHEDDWDAEKTILSTRSNMAALAHALAAAVHALPSWNGSQLTVLPVRKVGIHPASIGLVKVTRCDCGRTFQASAESIRPKIVKVSRKTDGPFTDPKLDDDFKSLLDLIKKGFRPPKKMVKRYLIATPSSQTELDEARKELDAIGSAQIRPRILYVNKPERGDARLVTVDERNVGMPLEGICYPRPDEKLEIYDLKTRIEAK
jgi:hypothetical protein